MIKNQLYPYIEKYINELLYGFTKEQFDIGVMKGEMKLEKLNFRPDGVNKILDEKNYPFWLKAGFINKIYIGCSLMNFIGEKPLDVLIEDIDIILTPSYKWIIKNLESFFYENSQQIKTPYDPNENNSMNIFERKVNIVDNSVLKNELILEIFKDGTKISVLINNLFRYCYKFFYMSNFLTKTKIKNIHIRFEDDQLINYTGNIAMGIKIESIDAILSSEGVMKKDSFKINNLNVYWECNAKILIPSDLLNNSLVNGELNQKYYENIKKLNFHNFNYIEGTKFIIQNLNCLIKIGTLAISSGKVDIFGKRNNQFKMYFQFHSNEININIFPELINIYTNFKKFMQEFSILEQVQDFKPMRKPYNKNNIIIKNFLKKNSNNKKLSTFSHKRKMLVRDWLFYFYWCKKCKLSIYNKSINPIRLEFNRFYGLCFNQWEDVNPNKVNENEKKDEEPINPDNIELFLSFNFAIKGININFHTSIKDINREYITIKLIGIESKLNSSSNLFDINTSIKNISISPNKLIMGENLIINTRRKKISEIKNNNIKYEKNDYAQLYDIEDNSGLFGLIKKYNPNYEQKVKMIDNFLDKIESESRVESRAMSEIDMKEFTPKFIQNKNRNTRKNIIIEDKNNQIRPSNYNNNNINNNRMPKNGSFVNKIISNYEASPTLQKMELTKQKKEFSISQAINEYNNRKTHERISLRLPNNNKSAQITGILFSKNQNGNTNNNDVISTGKKIPLNFIEVSSEDNKCIIFKYNKNNLDKMIDHLLIRFGTFRFNLFEDYIYSYLNILSKYKSFVNQPFINSLKKFEFDIKNQKELYKMQKYIYNYINKIPKKKDDEQINDYKNYLKKELNKSVLLGLDTDSFEINYLINLFSKGFDFDIDYESIELFHYDGNKKFCGKGIIPSSGFHLRIEPKLFKFSFFDFDFELNNLENTKIFISKIMKIFEEKLKTTKLFIEPCMTQMREEEKNKNENISNIKEIKNYSSLKVNKDNFDDDLEDLNMDDSLRLKKINIKQSKIPNHFYSETFSDKKIKDEENSANKSNNNNNIYKNKIVNIKKNNLPKVNKK